MLKPASKRHKVKLAFQRRAFPWDLRSVGFEPHIKPHALEHILDPGFGRINLTQLVSGEWPVAAIVIACNIARCGRIGRAACCVGRPSGLSPSGLSGLASYFVQRDTRHAPGRASCARPARGPSAQLRPGAQGNGGPLPGFLDPTAAGSASHARARSITDQARQPQADPWQVGNQRQDAQQGPDTQRTVTQASQSGESTRAGSAGLTACRGRRPRFARSAGF